jgi:hypothetical protein
MYQNYNKILLVRRNHLLEKFNELQARILKKLDNGQFVELAKRKKQLETKYYHENYLKYWSIALTSIIVLFLSPIATIAQPIGSEFLVNTYTLNEQFASSVAMDDNGNSIVVWQSWIAGKAYEISAQRYDNTGAAIGSEFPANTTWGNYQQSPSVAMDDNGNFVVAWMSKGQEVPNDGSYGIYAQRFDNTGATVGSEFLVNTYITGEQYSPSIAMDDDGDFVIAWESNGQDGGIRGIYAQRYSNTGTVVGSEFLVNTNTVNDQRYPSVAMDSDGDFVITWQSDGQDGSNNGIYAQRYNNTGATVGGEFLVNTYITSEQTNPSVAMDSDGDFVITWESNGQDGSSYGVYAQQYSNAGATMGGEFLVNTYTTSEQSNSSVAMSNDGNFVITWQSNGQDGSNYGVYSQEFNSNGVAVGTETQVNTYTTLQQMIPSVAMDNDGDFLIAWRSNAQDGSSWGTYAQRFSSAILPVQAPNALDFDGTNDYVNMGDVDALDGLSALTIETWVNVDAFAAYQRVVIKEINFIATNGWGIMIDPTGNVVCFTRNGANALGSTTSPLSLNTWTHLSYVFDGLGSTNAERLKLYINGVEQTLSYSGTIPTTLPSNSENFVLGAPSSLTNDFFNGTLDDVRIWTTARTAAEIVNNKNCELVGNESGLFGYYDFNQNTGGGSNAGATTLTDQTSNGNNGTLGNFALTGSTSNWLSNTITPPSEAVTIASDDADNTITSGTNVTFTATPTDGGISPSYQWKKNGTNVGANNATYTDAALANNDVITVEMTSAITCATLATSNSIGMTVIPSDIIFSPSDICEGDNELLLPIVINDISTPLGAISLTFNYDTTLLDYHSIRNSLPALNLTPSANFVINDSNGQIIFSWADLSGATIQNGDTLMVLKFVPDNGTFTIATTTDFTWDATSGNNEIADGSMNVLPANFTDSTATILAAPTVGLTNDATNNSICAGESIMFTATGGINYEFFVNGTSQSAASATATFTSIILADGDVVKVEVTNANGCSATDSDTITVFALSIVGISATDTTICIGDAVTFTGTGAVNYEFFINNILQGGASTTAMLTSTTLTNGDIIKVVGTNANGCIDTSTVITMVVNPLPIVGITATDTTICIGDAVTFTGTGAVNYADYNVLRC